MYLCRHHIGLLRAQALLEVARDPVFCALEITNDPQNPRDLCKMFK